MNTNSPSVLRRLASMSYDALLLLAVLFVATFIFLMLFGNALHGTRHYLLQLWLLCVSGAYFTWFWVHGGQTLAMKTWKIKVTGQRGEALSWQPALVRYVLSIPCIFTGIGILWAMFDNEGLFLHDRLVKTRLVFTSPNPDD